MHCTLRRTLFVCLFAALFLPLVAYGECLDGVHSGGSAKYRICMPAAGAWNGDLIIFAHGYVAPGEPVAIPESQLRLPDGTELPTLITNLGFAFATTSYRRNGLVAPDGVVDIVDLVEVFKSAQGVPRRIFVTGASEGGLVAVKALEQYPGTFHGALAACGPIGDFRRSMDHIGNLRVVFDYFFPNLLPPSAISIPDSLMAGWESYYKPRVLAALNRQPLATAQLISVTNLPVGLNPANIGDAVTSVLWYNVFATNDAIAQLGGNPFDNKNRWYSGSLFDLLLNLRVARFRADKAALDEIEAHYQTSGRLPRPLITLHTTADPVVPYWHETLYAQKAAAASSSHMLIQIPVLRYGHCNFSAAEVVGSFLLLVYHPLAQ